MFKADLLALSGSLATLETHQLTDGMCPQPGVAAALVVPAQDASCNAPFTNNAEVAVAPCLSEGKSAMYLHLTQLRWSSLDSHLK